MGFDSDSCVELLSEIRIYKLGMSPFDVVYGGEHDTPLLW